MNNTPLLAEDGAKLYGRVDNPEKDIWRASCYARLDLLSNLLEETPEYYMTDSEEDGRNWIAGKAAARGFASWWDETPRG